MTISTTSSKVVAQGNGATTAFTYNFLMPALANAVVTVSDPYGNQTVLNNTQFSISGLGNPNGGTLTYPLSGSPLAVGYSITLQRIVSFQQLTSLVNQNGYFPAVVEAAMDSLEMQIQQLNGNISPLLGQAVQLPVGYAGSNALPAASPGSLLGWNALGTAIVNFVAQTGTSLVSLIASSGSSLIGFIQSGTGAVATTQAEVNARTVNLLDYMTAAQKMDCYLRTGLIDSLPAMNACIAALTEQGTFVYPVAGRINLPKGLLYLNGTLTLAAGVHFVGHGAGQQGANWATSFKFPINTKGILVQKANTGPNQNGGDGSILEGIFIQGSGTTTTAHGIDMQARMVLRNCAIYGFGGNGINIVADSGVRTNANNWVIENCTSLSNGGHGLYVSGADSNAGYCHMLDASSNSGWGIYDNSFLGNTYIACHTASNVAGPYQSISANARSIFIGCYSEGGQPPSNITLTSFAMGGLHGAGFTADSNFLTTSGNKFQTASAMTSGSFTFGYNQPLTSGTFSQFYDTTGYYTWAQNKQIGSVGYQWANLGSPGYLLWYDRNATLANGYARDLSTGTAPTGTYGAMGIDQHYAGGIHQMLWRGLGTAPPTGVASLQGDIVYNTAPVSGGYIGWVCTASGTPGTWKTFGLIS